MSEYKLYQTTKEIHVGNLTIGGKNHVVIQSMCNIKTSKYQEVIKQILALEDAGCELIRVSIKDLDDVNAIPLIKKEIHIPLVADIHFKGDFAVEAVKAGADKIRINPGNVDIKDLDKIIEICKEKCVPIRLGVNSGSVRDDILKRNNGNMSKSLVENLSEYISYFESKGFTNLVLSLKSSDPFELIEANRLLANTFNYPIHIGLTEAGPFEESVIKSSFSVGTLLNEGIGNTIRISITDDPIKEISVCKNLLSMFGLYSKVNLISCPTCGRTDYNMISIINEIKPFLDKINKSLTVAIMGCVVNGPGEAKHADIGIAGGKDSAVLFKKGEVVRTLKQDEIVSVLEEEISKMVGLN